MPVSMTTTIAGQQTFSASNNLDSFFKPSSNYSAGEFTFNSNGVVHQTLESTGHGVYAKFNLSGVTGSGIVLNMNTTTNFRVEVRFGESGGKRTLTMALMDGSLNQVYSYSPNGITVMLGSAEVALDSDASISTAGVVEIRAFSRAEGWEAQIKYPASGWRTVLRLFHRITSVSASLHDIEIKWLNNDANGNVRAGALVTTSTRLLGLTLHRQGTYGEPYLTKGGNSFLFTDDFSVNQASYNPYFSATIGMPVGTVYNTVTSATTSGGILTVPSSAYGTSGSAPIWAASSVMAVPQGVGDTNAIYGVGLSGITGPLGLKFGSRAIYFNSSVSGSAQGITIETNGSR